VQLHHPPRALVFGASGYIGTHLVPHLQAAGWQVRAAARSLKVLQARHWSDVELAQADALQPRTLAAALAGIDVAFYLVHSMAAGERFGALDTCGRARKPATRCAPARCRSPRCAPASSSGRARPPTR
jgi:uncharacterized protein YbjT (DUF2867 family)